MLGQEFTVSDKFLLLCERFVGSVYVKSTMADVNELEYQLFHGCPSQSSCLPPTWDALQQIIHLANYQAALQSWALQSWALQIGPLPSPDSHGWETENDPNRHNEPTLIVKWMSHPAAPVALLELVSCGCSTGCSTLCC